MVYELLSYAQMEQAVNEAIEAAKQSMAFPERIYKNVYDKLFDGFDAGLLNLFCLQINWSLHSRSHDRLMKALLAYAGKIIELFPVLKKRLKEIRDTSLTVSEHMESALKAYSHKEDVVYYCDEIKHALSLLINDSNIDVGLLAFFNAVAYIIDGELMPAYNDKQTWVDLGFEQCLTNDKFLTGTSTSMNNLALLFQFVRDSINQSNAIIQEINSRYSAVIAFQLDGQVGVWTLVSHVTSKLVKEAEGFDYVKPPLI
jgi:hypothetical protein